MICKQSFSYQNMRKGNYKNINPSHIAKFIYLRMKRLSYVRLWNKQNTSKRIYTYKRIYQQNRGICQSGNNFQFRMLLIYLFLWPNDKFSFSFKIKL